ncbi:transmembrane protein 176B-like [Stegastes partitus]|uniref:Transmembrane protein 176B-like n=1 Tax=Stegastes partitus TaxID=144197 RepID=A0A9Y4K2J6_9TELE|nr:PREDICTED: transmembrane protein 176B-like [Stegastes partitus]
MCICTLQIMVGLLNLGLGAIHLSSGSWGIIEYTKCPFWLGALFIVFGIMCILSEKYPSPCLVILTVVLNLAGVAFAIAAIVLYSINIAHIDLWWYCDHDDDYWYERHHTTTPSPTRDFLRERCLEAKELSLMLLRGMNGILIVLSVLELCVVISSAVLGIKALSSRWKEPNKSAEEPEYFKPLLDEVTTDPGA